MTQDQEFYLTESLKQHPSAFIIFDKDLKIKWMNNSSKYIFTWDSHFLGTRLKIHTKKVANL